MNAIIFNYFIAVQENWKWWSSKRVARRLGLLQRKQTDWQSVLELTQNLRAFDPADPVKYDFALFGMGVLEFTNDDLGFTMV